MADKKAKKKGKGCAFTALVVLIVLAVAVFAAVKIFFPAEKIKAEIVKRASAAMKRTVELDDVSLSIFPKLSLDMKGLRIYNPAEFPGTEFVSIDRLSCGVKLMPLLRKQFLFDNILIDHPIVRLRKTVDGKTNYSFEIAVGGKGIQTPTGTKETVTAKEAALSPFAFDWAEIKNGDLTYQDDSSDMTIALSNFSLQTRLMLDAGGRTGRSSGTLKIPTIAATMLPKGFPLDIELAYNADIDFQYADVILKNTALKINGIPFELEATIRNMMNPKSLFARLKAVDVPLEPLLAYIPSGSKFDRDKLRMAGKLDGAIEIRREFGTGLAPSFSASFRFKDLTLAYGGVSNRVNFKALVIDASLDSAWFASQGGQLAGESFTLTGTVKNWSDLCYDVRMAGKFALAGLVPLMNPATKPELSGTLAYDLRVIGQKSNWVSSTLSGSLGASRVYYNSSTLTSPLNRLDMELRFAPGRTQVESLYVEYPGVRLSMTGEIRNGFAHFFEPHKGHRRPFLDFTLSSPLVDYDVLFPTEEEAAATRAAGGVDTLPPIFVPDIEAAGSARVYTLIYSGVEFTAITADVAYKDGIITYSNGKGRLYSGAVSSSGTVDFTDFYNPLVNCEFAGQDIEANDFMARFAKLDGRLFGKFNLKGTINGRGSVMEDFVRTMSADGDVVMREGRVVNLDLINAMAGQFGFKTFKEETLQDLAAAIKIRDGRLLLDGASLISRFGDWNIGGTVAFLDKTLDLDVGLYLAPEFAKNFNLLGGLLQDDKGRTRVNFKLGGSYDKPTISNLSTDNKAVQQKTQDAAKKEATKLIKDLFKKK